MAFFFLKLNERSSLGGDNISSATSSGKVWCPDLLGTTLKPNVSLMAGHGFCVGSSCGFFDSIVHRRSVDGRASKRSEVHLLAKERDKASVFSEIRDGLGGEARQ